MRDPESAKSLLDDHETENLGTDVRIVRGNRCCKIIYYGSISLNIVLGALLYFHWSASTTVVSVSRFSGLPVDTPVTYQHYTPYWGANQTLADELWEAVDTNPMVVALSDGYADEHGLDRSSRWPWDINKGRYFLKMFHQLHCLKYIRRHIVELERHNSSSLSPAHTQHCLDLLRKDVLCYGDDTPMPTNEQNKAIGDSQTLVCRNYDRVVEWAYAPERNACHRSLNEYKTFQHPVERYMFCEKGSRYYPVMNEYIQKIGHKDPYK